MCAGKTCALMLKTWRKKNSNDNMTLRINNNRKNRTKRKPTNKSDLSSSYNKHASFERNMQMSGQQWRHGKMCSFTLVFAITLSCVNLLNCTEIHTLSSSWFPFLTTNTLTVAHPVIRVMEVHELSSANVKLYFKKRKNWNIHNRF